MGLAYVKWSMKTQADMSCIYWSLWLDWHFGSFVCDYLQWNGWKMSGFGSDDIWMNGAGFASGDWEYSIIFTALHFCCCPQQLKQKKKSRCLCFQKQLEEIHLIKNKCISLLGYFLLLCYGKHVRCFAISMWTVSLEISFFFKQQKSNPA